MREIIATVIAVVSCIVCLTLVPKRILDIPKILASMPEGTGEESVRKIYKKAQSRILSIAALCMFASFSTLKIREEVLATPLLIAICAAVVVGTILLFVLTKFYRNLEKTYGIKVIGNRGNSCGIEGICCAITVAFAVYQVLLWFLL